MAADGRTTKTSQIKTGKLQFLETLNEEISLKFKK